ncbi:hypothetical protein [Bifidobacterium castoris]|uniref:Uncharacterized protein n=1 Tax=Bifidobacterium castoris TaxID=2306972 RepID=A0A430FAL4_9BIFI|nr:hypothetical protein [Bifidobacterium castoris]RSX49866.1 hypothetical protein D2E22_0327 [Bifidobacterium castoris]
MSACVFDPMDDRWWVMGPILNWWDSTLGSSPAWLADEGRAGRLLADRLPLTLRALALIHAHRTCETGQLHRLDARIPGRPHAMFWRSMAALRLIDAGFPMDPDGRARVTPSTAPWMAVRLPVHDRIETRLARLGANPVQIAAVGPGNLRGVRQYDRHNLICTDLSIRARRAGWRTAGEAYGRFDMLTRDPAMGSGGPDLILIGQDARVCVELTASANMGLERKVRRWDRALAHDTCRDTHVVWVNASRTDGILNAVSALCEGRPRQHAAELRAWAETLTAVDGWHPEPGSPPRARHDWARAGLEAMAAGFGFPDLDGWRLPSGFDTGALYD